MKIKLAKNSHSDLKWQDTALGALNNASLQRVDEGGCENGVSTEVMMK